MLYNTFNNPQAYQTIITGVRHADENKYKNTDNVLITGFYKPTANGQQVGYIYKGTIKDSNCGEFHSLEFPNSYTTSPYGPDRISKNIVNIVGNYTMSMEGNSNGFFYSGTIDGVGEWLSIVPPFENATNTICHSVMNGICVGNYALSLENQNQDLGIGAFIYDNNSKSYFKISKKNVQSITAYGIWHNHDNHYTIAGGCILDNKNRAYIVDWNSRTNEFKNFKTYRYGNADITHFDGITGVKLNEKVQKIQYNLTGDYAYVSQNTPIQNAGFFASVNRSTTGKFHGAHWKKIKYPESTVTSGNTIIGNNVLGVYDVNPTSGYVAFL